MAKGQKQKERAAPSHLAPVKKIKRFQKKKAKDAAARTPCASEANEVGDAAAGRKENGATGRLAGFMFGFTTWMMDHCFQYRVLGLPRKKLKLLENISKGTMLFLYDSGFQLLYGGYEAISNGGLNLKVAAFNGTRPAQVKFKKIHDCIPIHKVEFQYVILENYNITDKFNPELNSEQVKQLMSLFLRLAPDDRYRSGLYRSMIPLPQDAYRQPVAGTGLPPPREVYYQHPYAAGLPPPEDGNGQPAVAGTGLPPPREVYYQHPSAAGLPPPQDGYGQPVAGAGLRPPSSRGIKSRLKRILKQNEVIKEQIEVIKGLAQRVKVIQTEQPPAPPARDNGSLKATEGERASRAGHPPSAE